MNQKRHLDYDSSKEANIIEDKRGENRMEWRSGEWSRCSQTCGSQGKQVKIIKVN